MCFYSKQTKKALEVENRFKAKIEDLSMFASKDIINGFDFPRMAIIKDVTPNIISHYNWGLIPSWSNDKSIRKLTLNARMETIEDKPSFKKCINNRCLVIANGFYEWQWLDSKGKRKNKYEIGIENEELFAFAGIYSEWKEVQTNLIYNTFSIVTTQANPLMEEIHNTKKRMPIILKPQDESRWLQHEAIQQFALPYQANLVAKNLEPNLFS